MKKRIVLLIATLFVLISVPAFAGDRFDNGFHKRLGERVADDVYDTGKKVGGEIIYRLFTGDLNGDGCPGCRPVQRSYTYRKRHVPPPPVEEHHHYYADQHKEPPPRVEHHHYYADRHAQDDRIPHIPPPRLDYPTGNAKDWACNTRDRAKYGAKDRVNRKFLNRYHRDMRDIGDAEGRLKAYSDHYRYQNRLRSHYKRGKGYYYKRY